MASWQTWMQLSLKPVLCSVFLLVGYFRFSTFSLFCILGYLFRISFFYFNIAFRSRNNLFHQGRWLQNQGLFEVSNLEAIWKTPMNISWFRLKTLMNSLLNLTKYSCKDSELPWRTLNKLVMEPLLCFQVEKWHTMFLIRS